MRPISDEDFGTLAVCAIRYCIGRQSYMPSLVQSIIIPHLSELSDKDLGVMIQDCMELSRNGNFGSEIIDKPSWVDFRNKLLNEQLRRKS